jgi:hypothetical protein
VQINPDAASTGNLLLHSFGFPVSHLTRRFGAARSTPYVRPSIHTMKPDSQNPFFSMPSAPSRKGSPNTVLLFPFSIFCLISGTLFSKIAWHQLSESLSSKHWLNTSAIVDKSEAEYYSNGKTKGYSQKFEYHFQVGAAAYHGQRIDFNQRLTKTPGESQARVDQHKPGDRILIFYDPNNPALSIYRPGPQPSTYLLCALSILPLLLGSILLTLGIRRFIRPLPSPKCSPPPA